MINAESESAARGEDRGHRGEAGALRTEARPARQAAARHGRAAKGTHGGID